MKILDMYTPYAVLHPGPDFFKRRTPEDYETAQPNGRWKKLPRSKNVRNICPPKRRRSRFIF